MEVSPIHVFFTKFYGDNFRHVSTLMHGLWANHNLELPSKSHDRNTDNFHYLTKEYGTCLHVFSVEECMALDTKSNLCVKNYRINKLEWCASVKNKFLTCNNTV